MKLRANAGPKQAIAAYCEMQFNHISDLFTKWRHITRKNNISLMLVLTAGYISLMLVLTAG